MTNPQPTIRVNVDPTNPGQFFACCGLLELADRLWPGAEGWFDNVSFLMAQTGSLPDLVQAIVSAELNQVDPANNTSSPIEIESPSLRRIRLDWWQDEFAGGKELKVWAGTMESVRIARAMQHAMNDPAYNTCDLLNAGRIVYDPEDPAKKVEPFYFDARRTPNAHSRDVGFSPNDLHMTTTAFPAVEFLCLVGLQRCLPARTSQSRIFEYSTWSVSIPPTLLPPAVCGELPASGLQGYRFENWYRTGQKKHKAFRSAVPLASGV